MRSTVFLFCLMLVGSAGYVYGQKFEIIGGIGVGQCRMEDLRDIQDMKLASISLPAKIIDDFPWTLHYSGELNIQLKNFAVGFGYTFLTTGSRISYSDYSGELTLDLTAISHGLGPSIMYPVYKTEKIWVGPRVQLPLMFTRVTEKNYIRILDETDTDTDKIYSSSIGLFPSIEAKYILSRLSFGLKIGYLFDSKGRMVKDKQMTIYFDNKDYYTTDWSGFHFDFRLGFALFRG
jgi:hypothetical protein